MLCDILKSFPYTRDGLKSLHATKGEQTDIPDALVHGLEREGYVATAGVKVEAKSQPGAPENKAVQGGPENKAPLAEGDDLSSLRDEYTSALGKKPFMGWKADELRRRITEAGK